MQKPWLDYIRDPSYRQWLVKRTPHDILHQMAHILATDEQSWPLQLGTCGKEHNDNTGFIPNVSPRHLKITPLQQKHAHHSKPWWKKREHCFKEKDFSDSPGPFLSTCWRNLLPWDFSTEPLVCVSSRDTDFTHYSFVSISEYPQPNEMDGRLLNLWHYFNSQ